MLLFRIIIVLGILMLLYYAKEGSEFHFNSEILNQEYLQKNLCYSNLVPETLRKKQNDAYCIVSMATVSFCEKPNISNGNLFK